MDLWIIPGAPLINGRGWRIWCSHKGENGFSPPQVVVRYKNAIVPSRTEWRLFSKLAGLHRRMGLMTLTLEIPAPPEGALYQVTLSRRQQSQTFSWWTMPYHITSQGVTFLFASCFWRNNDREGYYRSGLRELQKLCSPQFKLLLGDQVYGDWPNDWNLGDDEIMLYAKRYRQCWGDGTYREALQSCPNFLTCDDHEFWNDYPEKQWHLPQTWDPKNRKKYSRGAQELYY